MIKEEEKKKEILKWLIKLKRLPTSRFMGLTGYSYDIIKELLNMLVKDKLIKKTVETNSIYWEMK